MNDNRERVITNKLPGNPSEIPYEILPLNTPINILQQPKAEMTTNPFIVEAEIKDENEKDHKNLPFSKINENIAVNFMGLLDDLFNKPEDEHWRIYLPMILSKNDRYTYLAILIFFVALFIILTR